MAKVFEKYKIIFNYSSLSTTHVVSTRSNQAKPLSQFRNRFPGEAQHLNLLPSWRQLIHVLSDKESPSLNFTSSSTQSLQITSSPPINARISAYPSAYHTPSLLLYQLETLRNHPWPVCAIAPPLMALRQVRVRISGIGIDGVDTSPRLKKPMAWCLFSRLFPSNSVDIGLLYKKFLILEFV